MAYTNSPLVDYTKISPNRTIGRNHTIDTITIHMVVGQCSVESLGEVFAPTSRKASSNYGVGFDGRIGMYVEEKDRAWTSSSGANDNRAVTIEVASDTKEPYAINPKAYEATIKLVADICKRNNIKKLMWKNDKSLIGQIDKQNMTVHRWFAATNCPGTYLMEHMGDIANRVNALLGQTPAPAPAPEQKVQNGTPFIVRVSVEHLNIRKGPGTNHSTTGRYTGVGSFTIVDVKQGQGSNAGWGLLKAYADNRDGWISLDYAKRI